MTPLQQHEYLFELVHDSVMTRTMEGRINFWNHSAEELYGWRKEEAIGRVSHNLLQTQFPKPLEEIESELVRNGLWEGKLVHTTRDGGRVVVESRWTLDLKGQSGAVVEINTRSTDWEIHPEARTDEVATERKQAQKLLEQTVTPLQQHEYLFELVHDSVMTRTMEGRINFWNHSAEELYGWRKEEAIGRVSHNLLQTQFPKPLEEIDSHLVRNGLWEGKLVHTTRDGGRVVVVSRWTLDLKGQSGAVVEINTRSTDWEIHPEARTDTYSAKGGRQEAVPPSKLVQKKEFLATAAKIADIALFAGGIFCFVVLFHSLYSDWKYERYFTSLLGPILYWFLPAAFGTVLLAATKLHGLFKLNLAVLIVSTGLSIYAVEISLHLVDSLKETDEEKRVKAARQSGINLDTRSQFEVVTDLRSTGVGAVPAVMPQVLLQEQANGELKSEIAIDNAEVLTLGGIANKVTVLCNENGDYLIYESDEHGFHNPKGIWNTSRFDVAAVGDSFTHGACVASDKNFVSLIRNRYPATLNLGYSGNGPLMILASIKEYLPSVKPKLVLWFHCKGNDFEEMAKEKHSSLLMRYLQSDFKQGLLSQQGDIDKVLMDYVERAYAAHAERLKDDTTTMLGNIGGKVASIIKLTDLRNRVGLVYTRTRYDREHPNQLSKSEMDLFGKVLQEAKRHVDSWGGTLVFVYLPMLDHFTDPAAANKDREDIVALVNTLGIPVIDIYPAFQAHKDPLALFPFGLPGHYTDAGNRLVAEEVLKSISLKN